MDLNAFTNANGSIVQSNQGVCVFVPRPLPPSFEYDKAITQLIAESHTKTRALVRNRRTATKSTYSHQPVSQTRSCS